MRSLKLDSNVSHSIGVILKIFNALKQDFSNIKIIYSGVLQKVFIYGLLLIEMLKLNSVQEIMLTKNSLMRLAMTKSKWQFK